MIHRDLYAASFEESVEMRFLSIPESKMEMHGCGNSATLKKSAAFT